MSLLLLIFTLSVLYAIGYILYLGVKGQIEQYRSGYIADAVPFAGKLYEKIVRTYRMPIGKMKSRQSLDGVLIEVPTMINGQMMVMKTYICFKDGYINMDLWCGKEQVDLICVGKSNSYLGQKKLIAMAKERLRDWVHGSKVFFPQYEEEDAA